MLRRLIYQLHAPKKNEQYVKSLGATHFVDYTQNIEEQLKSIIGMEKGVDVWIDMIGNESLKFGMQNLRFSGEAVTILGAGNEVAGGQFFGNQATLHGVALGWVYTTKSEELCKELKNIGDKCIQLYQQGILKTNIEQIFPFSQVKDALHLQKSGHVRGKLVIDFECKQFLSQIPSAPPDSILGLSVAFKQCTDSNKVNLGVGAYRDDDGKPVVLSSVKQAEKIMFDKNLDNEYLQPHGHEQFINAALELAYSKECKPIKENRVLGFQTLSGTGGLFIAFEFLNKFQHDITIHLPNPTWPNHNGIIDQLELKRKTYRYYSPQTNSLDFTGMMEDLHQFPAFSVVLFHACSHNPTGIDPTQEQWKVIKKVCEEKQFVVLFDMAYQGFTSGCVDNDAWALRFFAESDLLIFCVQSFAKNMGLYGQRIGCLSVICSSPEEKSNILSQLKIVSRRVYSNPPLHGARIVQEVLTNPELYQLWLKEVKAMADRIISMRALFVKYIKEAGSKHNWDHIISQKGMFAYTGINSEQVKKLKEECFIFLTNDGRISIAGLNTKNCKYVAECFHKVTQ
eukprot:TRINITY_DN788_c0_g1_i2.p1 TRINITY_DN788_c0_g1~~TRINITY_DN788_c0_g1_i2.p1  ORF type:complete len:567 (-),score=59.21 TRINITY_DN788_c0_g1_i2:99-1799(-)